MRTTIPGRWSAGLVLVCTFAMLAGCVPQGAPPPTTTPVPAPVASSPAPTPTALPPAELLEYGLTQRRNGEFIQAAGSFQRFLDAYSSHPRRREAQFYLAESAALRHAWAASATALEQYVQTAAAGDRFQPRALIWLARSYAAQGEHGRAADTYQRYVQLGMPLAPYALFLQAEQAQQAGDLHGAAAMLEQAAHQPIARVEQALAFERAADLAMQAGQAADAQRLYADVLALAEVAEYRAAIMHKGAAAAQAAGDETQRRAWLADTITSAPASDAALDAVQQLLETDAAMVAPAAVASVYAAHENWDAARAQFDLAIGASSGERQLDLRRLRALTLRNGPSADYEAALAELAAIGAESPNSEAGRQAQLDWIQTRGQSGDVAGAIAAYQEYVAAYPDDTRAPEAWRRLAILLDRSGDPLRAADERAALAQRYPAFAGAADALAEAALAWYAAGELDQSRLAWQELAQSPSALQRAQGMFWAGKILHQQGDPAATAILEQALAAAPESYYGARAADLLGHTPGGSVAPLAFRLSDAEWQVIDAWLAAWAGGAALDVTANTVVQRAIELDALWMPTEAANEWKELLDTWRDDARRLAGLARVAHQQQLDHVAVLAAVRLRALAPRDAPLPPALQRLTYPAPFADVIHAEAEQRSLDPFLVYALLRQESNFDPHATSWVGARGLGQVMPETGQGIARNLGMAEYTSDDLYRPVVSIRFGAAYLAEQLRTLDGSIQGALAAYNGGLGNVYRWSDDAPLDDPDLFVERIDFPETRNYVKLVYGFYHTYRAIYQGPS